ncbi:cyclophilin-like fold protein [Labilibaculum sp. K2S]|uniref:cyclophilin-like fold protein n=1 Tax=Labilibaculum sp. K2S TaxID=3056386 RepID=UPI0025A3AB5C|nr:cyclophilin-like fold protein [Labilibaculum sp. K2S]MDM8159708.1 cyclophilin-like fold protein [Labilibaculum sp. K2S]
MKAKETAKIKITIGSTSFVASTYGNETAKAFVALLSLTINMNELNGNEKYHYLSNNLPSAPAKPGTIHSGDIMLWGQNCVVLFYEAFSTSYSYTKIGYIDNPAGLDTALGIGNPTVTFEMLDTANSIVG